jgi:hypothetical protein
MNLMSNERSNSWFSLLPTKSRKARTQPQRSPMGRSTLDWDFGADGAPTSQRSDGRAPQPKPVRRPDAALYQLEQAVPIPTSPSPVRRSRQELPPLDGRTRRVMGTRMALDEALDHWWTDGTLPALGLLRDGLLLLEAGHTLDEAQSSFLLRVALRRQRGMITALRYQRDPDRTAFLIKEALLDQKQPLPPTLLVELQREDDQSASWLDYLVHDLTYEVGVAQGKRRELATRALVQIRPDAQTWALMTNPTATRQVPVPLSYRWRLRWLLWAFLLLVVDLCCA